MPEFDSLEQAADWIAEKIASSGNHPSRIALDGRCASGKTTLASMLAERLHASLFHMDDFFLPLDKRTSQRLSEPGGNVDYERFSKEVLQPLCKNESVILRPFDCPTKSLKAPVTVPFSGCSIIEGSYALHPALRSSYNFRIFLDCSRQTQQKRLQQRETPDHYQMFLDRWIPLEELYFHGCQVPSSADLVIHTDNLF